MIFKTAAAACLLVGLAATPALSDGCSEIGRAHLKLLDVPVHHIMVTHKKDGTEAVSETISLGGHVYTKLPYMAHWMDQAMKPADMAAARRMFSAVIDDKNEVCHAILDDGRAGEPADVFAVHDIRFGSDSREWISKSSGLPLRAEGPLVVFKGATMTETYVYTNVRPPTN
jgi:hypothetical protein